MQEMVELAAGEEAGEVSESGFILTMQRAGLF